MAYTIAVVGKGGVGKTSISALVVRELLRRGRTPVLAVDADSNVNLNEALGIPVGGTVGSIREEMLDEVRSLPSGMSKEAFVQLKIEESLVEAEGFDLLVMGRPEGPGCYCYANNILRRYVDMLSKRYPFIVVDNEAGMEHLSRRTTRNVDLMLIVTDATPVGLMTAERIWRLARDMDLQIEKSGLVVNRATGVASKEIDQTVLGMGVPLEALLPLDENLAARSNSGQPLLGMTDDSPAVQAVGAMLDRHIS